MYQVRIVSDCTISIRPSFDANVFLNVEELIQVNAKFTEALKDAIEIALDQGDEDLCTVSIGKLFLEAAPMLGAFKSYCTRQVRYLKFKIGMTKDTNIILFS